MNKKVSKTLAAVLSAAMAASAFAVSTGAAFAADNQISATVSAGSIGIVNNTDAASGVDLWTDVVKNMNGNITFTVNGYECTNGTITLKDDDWTADQNDSRYVDLDGNTLKAGDASKGMTAPRTVTVRHRATISSANVGISGTSNTPLTADVMVEVEVTIYPEGYYIVLPDGTYDAGATPSNEVTLSMNEPVDLETYYIHDVSNDTAADFTKVTEDLNATVKSNGASLATDYSSDNSVISVDAEGNVKPQSTETPQTGTATVKPDQVYTVNNITSPSYTWSQWLQPANMGTYVNAVEKEKIIEATVTVNDTYKVYNAKTDEFTSEGDTTRSEDRYDVEDANVIIDADEDDVPTVSIGHDAELGTISGGSYAGTIAVEGSTGNITAGSATVNVGDDSDDIGTTITTGDITANTIKIEGINKTSNISTAYENVQVGNLEGQKIDITAYDNNDKDHPIGRGRVVVGNIKLLRDGGTDADGLTLTAGKYVNTMTIGTISGEDGPYADSPFGTKVTVAQGKFDLGDLNKIGKVVVGTSNTTADVTVGTIDTGVATNNNEWLDYIKNESAVQVNGGSKLAATKITTDVVLPTKNSGAASYTLPVDSFMIKDSKDRQVAINANLYVTGAEAGDVLYTGYNNAGANFIFNQTNSKVVGQKIEDHAYNYVLEQAAFDGIRMTTPNVSVGETPVTLSLAAMPDSTTLPEGVTVSWTATTDTAGKQTVSLTPSADGMSCVVTATGYTADNINNGNNVVVTATLMKDGKVYGDVAANTATANVTLTDEKADKPLTGIALSETSMTMQPEETQQLTVTYTPADTNSDKTVTWSTSDEAVATVDAEGNVTAVADGTATITATCGEFTATCEVTVSENPFTVVVTNAEGEEITCALDGSTVIEVPQSMAFNFDISSEEEIADFDYTVGNCKVGGTNTNTVWNGTSGSYQIYAAGAVGSETGAYINGIKIFTLRVTDRPFTSDTTLNMNISRGQTYQFAITPNDPDASFTFLTANGEALSTSYNAAYYPDGNGTYYCKVTANAVNQDVGVYCVIDGKTYKVFTAHLVG